MNLQEILFEIIKEAEQAKVKLGSDEFYIGFNTIINDVTTINGTKIIAKIIKYNSSNDTFSNILAFKLL